MLGAPVFADEWFAVPYRMLRLTVRYHASVLHILACWF